MGKKEVTVEMQVIDVLVGACAGLTARKIVKGISEAFCDNRGLIVKIGTATLGLYAAIGFGVKGGSMFYHARKGATKAYHDICDTKPEEKEEEPEEKTSFGTTDCYDHPEQSFSVTNRMNAIKLFTFCTTMIKQYGYVTVSDMKNIIAESGESSEEEGTRFYIDNVDGWSNMEDFDIGKTENERFYVTKVKPYRIDIYRKSEGIKYGESKA